MLFYARSDTHFLLYIYDNLRNALLDRALSHVELAQPSNDSSTLIREVLARSEETALRTYEPQLYDAEGGSGRGGWEALARKWNKGALLEGSQRGLFLAVHTWRDRVAREDDESTRFVDDLVNSLG